MANARWSTFADTLQLLVTGAAVYMVHVVAADYPQIAVQRYMIPKVAGQEDHSGYSIWLCISRFDILILFTDTEVPVPVRLADGTSPLEGRVELNHGGVWGTICDDDWDINDANVICNSLGHNGATAAVLQGGFGRGAEGSPIFLDDVDCTGRESAIEQCNHRGFEENNCGHLEDAGVRCRPCK